MSAVAIVGALLNAHAPLLAALPDPDAPERIKAHSLPEGWTTPALLVRSISRMEMRRLRRGAAVLVRARVRVTVLARDWEEQVALLRHVRAATGGKIIAGIAGATGISVQIGLEGPDIEVDGSIYEQSQDLELSLTEPA